MNYCNLKKAMSFAEKAHDDQKYDDKPYLFHLNMVVDILDRLGFNDEVTLSAAFLHDVVEDTPITLQDIEKEFGPNVAFIVQFCTDAQGESRDERKAETHRSVKKSLRDSSIPNPLKLKAISVKYADRIANVGYSITSNNERMLSMYIQEFSEFRRHYSIIYGIPDLYNQELIYGLDHMVAEKTIPNSLKDIIHA